MFLIGDIGNTETKICLLNENLQIKKRLIFSTNLKKIRIIKKNLKLFISKKIDLEFCLFSSVVPNFYRILKDYLYKYKKIKSFELKDIAFNKKISLKVNKSKIGSDRIANALGAMNNKDNFIIIDFGTATTFDVLIKKTYHGGIIAPGIKLSLETLYKKASLIPKLNLKQINKVIGVNTHEAVRSGFFWGYTGLINNMVKMIENETKKKFKIIITGGYSKLYKKNLGKKVIYDKDITIKGLKKLIKLKN
mgnify:FL=1